MTLPPDSHVHSEWSWDAIHGSMERTCERALAIGLPAIAFTEHLDHSSWRIALDGPYADERITALSGPDAIFTPPPFDVAGYFAAIERCRSRFPGLLILSGLEMGQPHLNAETFAEILAAGPFDRVLGSLHCLPDGGAFAEPWHLYPHRDAKELIREYLAEVIRLVEATDSFAALAHIDYPVRFWPAEREGRFDPAVFEEEFRAALRATASAGRALEINTRLPLHATILGWWREEGGETVSFGSDAHVPEAVGHGFREAAAMAEGYGFRPGASPYDFWRTA
ncbi:PHP domain-containing protein [Actinoplanes sp. GCM10030250]|uniref:PHP domain-containing protein n=1 Tax=Actinoplanes sp. GCM10030250 TaxID=3273376 RepID=UPI00361E161D